jgi:hypothetical protein
VRNAESREPGADVDDRSAAVLDHRRGDRGSQEERCLDVDRIDLSKVASSMAGVLPPGKLPALLTSTSIRPPSARVASAARPRDACAKPSRSAAMNSACPPAARICSTPRRRAGGCVRDDVRPAIADVVDHAVYFRPGPQRRRDPQMGTRLEHKAALVTGATSDIGRAIATASQPKEGVRARWPPAHHNGSPFACPRASADHHKRSRPARTATETRHEDRWTTHPSGSRPTLQLCDDRPWRGGRDPRVSECGARPSVAATLPVRMVGLVRAPRSRSSRRRCWCRDRRHSQTRGPCGRRFAQRWR